jgi:selenophosphate synthetase-related protein
MRELIQSLKSSERLTHKQGISSLWDYFPKTCEIEGQEVLLGDDAAAVKSGDDYLLLAAEGVYQPLIESNPYLAGRTAVLTNVVVGGHLSEGSEHPSLAVFILGKARKLLSSFTALPGDDLVFISNLKGKFNTEFNFWDSSSMLEAQDALGQLRSITEIAEAELADTAKDVSMAGLIGSILMLLESSGKGAEIYIDSIQRPYEVPLSEWLLTFPSFGFIFSLRPDKTPAVKDIFDGQGLSCESIGKVTSEKTVYFVNGHNERELFWDLNERSLIGINGANGSA